MHLTSQNWSSIIVGFLVLLSLLMALGALVSSNRQKGQREASKRAVIMSKSCPICGGEMTPGEIRAGFSFLFKSKSKLLPIGAARCEKCGHVIFFA